ncbi:MULTISPECIES: BTAD domain-containing putative transcriptional regulator [Actinosynnema]|uniref:AfsR/SARP family transcriptional regulator n=1 Tax=Actinosynnema TaxID=40566 RepID=UPI0020A370C5|nr:BTAD domain-containing putative transcriptional regulator [Actinosynnema pretiosum]MCP2097012.1 DNA-binding transcriptional activator of the SARP family [Actinosynnema pretiosum]
MGEQLELGVLGPLRVVVGGRPVAVRAGRQRCLLASLLTRPGAPISVDELAEHVWGDRPPARARQTLHTYVMRLRQVLGPEVPIRTVPDGYLVDVPASCVDAARFAELLALGDREQAAGRLAEASSALAAALELWRGPALADVPSAVLHRDEAPRLTESALHARERRAEIDLAIGRHAELVPELTALTAEHPLRERLWAQLVVALHRSGRRAEALAAYDRVSALLAEELGIDPGGELRRVHRAVLADEGGRSPAPEGAESGPEPGAPSQLPARAGDFVGRSNSVHLVETLLRRSHGVPVVTLSGQPGVGKTALAVHAAHRLRGDFPDGQLYVNLRGHAQGPPLSAVDVLPRFLRAQGVAPEAVPLDPDEQEALHRSRLTGKRVLVVLDDAASAEQIRPLLPGSPGCAVLVTSRDALRGLAVSHAATNVRLDVLDDGEARALLSGVLGADVVGGEHAATGELVALCAHLPLALRIAAANVLSRPGTTVSGYVAELRAGNRLAALSVAGDERTAVQAAFDLSYAALKPELAQLFRLLAVAPGDLTPDLAAALGGLPAQEARRRLDRLATVNLLDRPAPGRYQFHDLLRDYAVQRLVAEDGEAGLDRVFRRLLDWSIRSVDSATGALKSTLVRHPRDSDVPGVEPKRFDSPAEALAWLDAERANLVALVSHAAARPPHEDCWQLVDALRRYFYLAALPVEWQATAGAGLASARAARDPVGEAAMLSSLGVLYWSVGRHPMAIDRFLAAVGVQERGGAWPRARAQVLSNLGAAYIDVGELERATEHLERALAITRETGALQQEGITQLNLGGVRLQLAELDLAAACFRGALDVGTRLGAWMTQADALHALAEVELLRGAPERAAGLFERAGELYGLAGARIFAHIPHEGLAQAHLARGRYAEAIAEAGRALEFAQERENLKGRCDAKNVLGQALVGAGRLVEGAGRHTEALGIAGETSYPWGIVAAHRGLATAHHAAGRLAEAEEAARKALDRAADYRLRLPEGDVLVLLGRIELDLGELDRALDSASRAAAAGAASGRRLLAAQADHLLGDLRAAGGDSRAARALWGAAAAGYESVGAPEAAALRTRLRRVS